MTHAGITFEYRDGGTCAVCHTDEGHDVVASNHFQWAGKLGAINDFCGYPDINFIGKMTNLLGTLVDGGCATCHVGMGAKPSIDSTADDVDCLMCHSAAYRRSVELVDNVYQFVPSAGSISVNLPGRAECLRCHAYSGGGNNNKRGDLEAAHIEPASASFDVHMASTSLGGAGLVCTDCHLTQQHQIAGNGVDMRINEGPAIATCTTCHTSIPHDNAKLNDHTRKVACQTCHIPAFARGNSTDMLRDFRHTEVDALKNLFEPALTRQSNVIPTYAFWNGEDASFYEFMSPAQDGQNLVSINGSLNDVYSKLYPFKVHQAIQPYDPVTQFILPLKMGILFQTGNTDLAIRTGASNAGIDLSGGYTFISTYRYMGIYHEVAPANQAISCSACHDTSTRINFPALGYNLDATYNGRPLCTACHEPKSEWSGTQYFYGIHDKHVDDKNIACRTCHTFNR